MTKKRMLLGSAAALTAISSVQAADLPVKAKPVEYVKICSLYGEGFFYIPGSDICLKIGGYVQSDYGWNLTGARTPQYSGAAGAQDRSVSPYSTRHRAHFNFDSRTQTAYGTLRTYVAVHIDNENQGTVTVNPTRAFIQWAGFTFGHTKSFTDVPGTPQPDTFRSLMPRRTGATAAATAPTRLPIPGSSAMACRSTSVPTSGVPRGSPICRTTLSRSAPTRRPRSGPISIRHRGRTLRSTRPGAGLPCRRSSTRSTQPTTTSSRHPAIGCRYGPFRALHCATRHLGLWPSG